MPSFVCGVHVDAGAPAAFALFETVSAPETAPRYVLRMLRQIDGAEALGEALASEEQYAGHVEVAATGGADAAEALHGVASVTAYAVASRFDGQGEIVTSQQLADTFERLFRDGAVETPTSSELATAAFDALHGAADLDAVARDSNREPDGVLLTGVAGSPVETLDGVVYRGDRATSARLADLSRAVERTGREARIGHAAAAAVGVALWHAESTRLVRENLPEDAEG